MAMKELYYTPQTLERQALELYQLAREFSREKNNLPPNAIGFVRLGHAGVLSFFLLTRLYPER